MFDIFRAFINQVVTPTQRASKYKPPADEMKKEEEKEGIKKATKGLFGFIPPSPYRHAPELPPAIRFDDMQSDLTEITNADKLCFTGIQIQSMSIIDNRFMFAHSIHAGKKEEKHGHGEEKSGWAFQTGFAPVGTWSLTGRYNSEVTTVGTSMDTVLGSIGLNFNFSELPEKSHWDFTLYSQLMNTFITYRTQSLLYHSVSWATWLWTNLSVGTEIQALPWLPNAPPQSRLKFCGTYSIDQHRHCYISYASGNLGKTVQELGLGYVRQLSPCFQTAVSYDLGCSQDNRWKSLLKLGYLLHGETDKAQSVYSLRGFIDSGCKLAALGEIPLKEGINFSWSAKFDYFKNIYDLGIGVNFASNGLTPDLNPPQ